MTCPEPETLAAFSCGALASGAQVEVETHLDGCDRCGQVVADLVRVYATESGDSPPPPSPQSTLGRSETLADEDDPPRDRSPTLGPGARLDRYHILEPVGAGGMGVVYAAYDAALDRKVALKVLHEHATADDRAQRRLTREAQAMARLAHPNVITVHEVRAVDGRVFISMEFVEGGTLSRWLVREQPGWERVLAMFRDIGRGLAAAHDAGLVHRDVKPDNVLIGADERPRVTDFGLARAADDDVGASRDGPSVERRTTASGEPFPSVDIAAPALNATLTRTGALVGTPAYMAPEQFRRQAVTAASDQFSFCVALYEALYGQRPFSGRSLPALASNVLSESIAEPPRDASVPRWVRQVIRRGLSLRPEDRWPSMDALVERLEPAVRRPWRRIAAGGALAAVAAAGLVATYGRSALADPCAQGQQAMDELWFSTERQRVQDALARGTTENTRQTATLAVRRIDDYAEQWVAGHQGACQAHRRGEQSDEALDLRHACLDLRRTELTALVTVLIEVGPAAREHAIAAVDELPPLSPCEDVKVLRASVPIPDDPQVLARVQQVERDLATARARFHAGQYDDALRIGTQVTLDAQQSGYQPLVARARFLEGSIQSRLGRYDMARERLNEAWQTALAAGDDATAAQSVITLIDTIGYWLRDTELARSRVGDAEAMIERLERIDEPLARDYEAELAAIRGRLALRDHRYDESAALYRKALEHAELHDGPDSLGVARLLVSLGSVYAATHSWEEALAVGQRSLDIHTARLGGAHPETAHILNNLGLTFKHLGRYDESIATFEHAHAVMLESLGADHPGTHMVELNLAEVLFMVRRYAEATALYDRGFALTKPEEIEDAFLLRRLAHYGYGLVRVGRLADARRVLHMVVDGAKRLGEMPAVHHAMDSLAYADIEAGEPQRALERLDELSQMGVSELFSAQVALTRARALLARGEPGDREAALVLRARVVASGAEHDFPRVEDVTELLEQFAETEGASER